MKNNPKEKIAYLEILRLLACFFVIYNHTDGYALMMTAEYNTRIWLYMFVAMFTRFNVLIFFMISGYLLLKKEEPISHIYKKRISKIVILLFIFSLIQYLRLETTSESFGILDFISKFSSNGIKGTATYWFLYRYVSFLILLPFLRALVKKIGEEHYIYLIILHFVIFSIPEIIGFFAENYYLNILVPIAIEQFIFFPLIGYWLGMMDENRFTGKGCIFLISLSIIGIVIETCMTISAGSSGNYTQNYVKVFDYVIAITVFYVVRFAFSNNRIAINEKACRIISYCGGLTLGIYVLEPIIKEYIPPVFNFKRFGAFYGSFAYCLFAMIVCGAITAIIKMIPVIKKLF